MAREKENFRVNYEQILKAFPDRDWLKIVDVSRYLGRSVNTVKKHYPTIKENKGCNRAELARLLCP
ncbi:MAG: hypothetical protein ACI4SB_04615 [Acutalibacteraceae bacterium]